jgi:hypothetical protein
MVQRGDGLRTGKPDAGETEPSANWAPLSTKGFSVRILCEDPHDFDFENLSALLVNRAAAFTGAKWAILPGSSLSQLCNTAQLTWPEWLDVAV